MDWKKYCKDANDRADKILLMARAKRLWWKQTWLRRFISGFTP